jgi:hypothetical protein
MERTYYAVASDDWATAEAIIEGRTEDEDEDAYALDKERVAALVAGAAPGFVRTVKDFERLAKERGYTVDEAREIFGTEEIIWSKEGRVRVVVDDAHVEIALLGGGAEQGKAVAPLFVALRADGLHVWDPVSEKLVSE